LAVLLIATILISEENRSPNFWHRMCWTEFLIFLVWGSFDLYLLASGQTRYHISRLGGIAPTISIVIAFYALLSFGLMMIHAFVPATDVGNRIHLITQVIFFAGAALCVVFLSMAQAGAAAGLDFDKNKAMSPRELHDLLSLHESSLPSGYQSTSGLKAAMKQLRETLLYSLNESASLAQSPQYQALSGEVQELCQAIEGERNNRYDPMTESAKRLAGKAKYVSTSQARR